MITVAAFVVAAAALALGRSFVIGLLNTQRFPVGTLAVNAAGSLAAALLLTRVPDSWQTVTGFAALGAFTTFSTFAVEVAALWEAGRRGAAVVYALLTPTAAVAAAFIGLGL